MNTEETNCFFRDDDGYDYFVDKSRARCGECGEAHNVRFIQAGVCETELRALIAERRNYVCEKKSLLYYYVGAFSLGIDLLLCGAFIFEIGYHSNLNELLQPPYPVVSMLISIILGISGAVLLAMLRRYVPQKTALDDKFREQNNRLRELERLLKKAMTQLR